MLEWPRRRFLCPKILRWAVGTVRANVSLSARSMVFSFQAFSVRSSRVGENIMQQTSDILLALAVLMLEIIDFLLIQIQRLFLSFMHEWDLINAERANILFLLSS